MPVSASNFCAAQREETKQNAVPVCGKIAHRSELDFIMNSFD
jgi:hypothetical protein